LLQAVRTKERRSWGRSDKVMSDTAIAALSEPEIEGLKAGLRGSDSARQRELRRP
jgi:hypothetical protein